MTTISAHHLDIDGRIGFVQEVVPARPNGTTLLLLHTAGQSGVQWRRTLVPLADLGYRLLVPDLPGHGHSEPHATGVVTDLAVYSDWCVTLLDRLAPDRLAPQQRTGDQPAADRTVVVGCSIGGKVSQDLAARHGHRFAAAVSMCAPPGPGKVKLHALRRELEDSAAPARTDRTFIGTQAVVGRAVDADRRDLIARMHCREDPEVSGSDLIGWGTHDVRELLPTVPCPVTFVAGEDDLWVAPRTVAAAAQQVPAGRYVLLEGYGHYPMEEMPEFAKVLDDWISSMLQEVGA
ncbi:alpha/beta fold hydrolase [Intrasporangium chromatireducens]|uniref:alpha/beta fold hydrolase n=1 Tax=Intrasporangium chromatireducens TaxID=1386088 RepID=UPI0004ADAD14|nr:alpha/beta hydrolase [Intrasporangium chromatireducens]